MIADAPEAFADRVVHLLEDGESWLRLSSQARRLVEKSYDWEYITSCLHKVYQSALR